MFSAKFKYSVNPIKHTITLTPTLGLYVKAIVPSVAIGLGLGVVAVGVAVELLENNRLDTDRPQND